MCQRLCQHTRNKNLPTWNTHKQRLYSVSHANDSTLVCEFWGPLLSTFEHRWWHHCFILPFGDDVYTNKGFLTRSDDKIDSLCRKDVICRRDLPVLHIHRCFVGFEGRGNRLYGGFPSNDQWRICTRKRRSEEKYTGRICITEHDPIMRNFFN